MTQEKTSSKQPQMPYITDLHIHSHYSRATSPHLNIEELYHWGKRKGIHIMGTGDFTHPAWFRELQEKLEPAEPGLYRLKNQYAKRQDATIPESCRDNVIRFVLTVEISNVYTRDGRGRRVHNVVVMPSFESAGRLNTRLAGIGNLAADGRPMLGMDSEDLLLSALDADADALFIPAHIWTPWYAMFGSKSGFDSLEEAFGENKKHVHAIETGLSSDPAMNWRLSDLDGVTIVSNSDAHSPQKLAREANLIACKLDYYDMVAAIESNDDRFIGTIEFFPEEGKYHYDGHRKCNVRWSPEETKKNSGICPQCGRAVTVGVDNRIHSLADRPVGYTPNSPKRVEYIIPLVEIISEIRGVKSTSAKSVVTMYDEAIEKLGNEFGILRTVPIEDIKNADFPLLAQAIEKMRQKDVDVDPGYDGVFGTVKVFGSDGPPENPQQKDDNQLTLGL